MAVFVTGDCHGDFRKIYNFADRMELNENDAIIVLGDMGILWRNDKKDANVFIKDFEIRYNFNLYFIDGNHENFKLLKQLPIVNDMGEISQHIHWLRRGRRYNINGKDILALGGADSVDRGRRESGLNWWEDERITNDDINLVDEGHYDYVLTHCCPTSIFELNKIYLCTLGNIIDENNPEIHISENKLEQVKNFITFNKWYFGHYHVNKQLDNQFTCLLDNFEELE